MVTGKNLMVGSNVNGKGALMAGKNSQEEDPYASQYGYGSGGGGYYGAGGTAGPTDNDKKAMDALGAISGFNYQTPQKMAELGDKMYDISDKGNENIRDFAINNAKRKSASEWYKDQQDLQSVASQLADASGNLMNGSGLLDFVDLIARRDDEQDVEILNTAHDNENSIWNDFFEGMQQNINARNNAYIDAQESMRNIGADYVAQGNSIHPDLVEDYLDKDNHTLKLPDWMNSDGWAEKRFRQAVEPQMADFYRPAMDALKATNENKVDREPTTVNQPSTNKDYWTRMRQGYKRRSE